MRRDAILLLLGCGVLVALAALLFAPVLVHTRQVSLDRHFEVVVRTQPIYRFVPVMPGSGSDKPAWATLYKDARSCGSAALPTAWFIQDLQWDFDARPRRAEIRLVASWNLDDCTVEAQ